MPGNRDLALNASEACGYARHCCVTELDQQQIIRFAACVQVRTARFPDSIAKLLGLMTACDEIGVLTPGQRH